MSTPGVLHALLLDGAGRARSLAWADVQAWTPDQGLLWLDLDYHTPEVMTWQTSSSNVDPITISALTDSDPRPRAAVQGENLLLVLHGINNNAGAEPEDMISVRAWVEPRRIITLRHRHSTTVQSLATGLERGTGPRAAGDFTLLLVEGWSSTSSHVSTCSAMTSRPARTVRSQATMPTCAQLSPITAAARSHCAASSRRSARR